MPENSHIQVGGRNFYGLEVEMNVTAHDPDVSVLETKLMIFSELQFTWTNEWADSNALHEDDYGNKHFRETVPRNHEFRPQRSSPSFTLGYLFLRMLEEKFLTIIGMASLDFLILVIAYNIIILLLAKFAPCMGRIDLIEKFRNFWFTSLSPTD